jgi:hypothetical protein
MTTKIRSFVSDFKRRFSRGASSRRPLSPQEEIARLRRQVASLERRNAELAEENLSQAGYIRFLTGKCITFEIACLVRRVEKGEVIA